METLPWYDENYINNPCGFSITGSYLAFFRQIRAYPASHQSPTAPGQLVLGDNAGGTSKDFGLLIDKVVDAKDQAQSIHDNPPVYGLHSYNCVDAALAVASAAGVDLGNCRFNVFLEDTSTGSRHMEQMSLPEELANALEQ